MIKIHLTDLNITMRLLGGVNNPHKEMTLTGGNRGLRRIVRDTIETGYGKHGLLMGKEPWLAEDVLNVLDMNGYAYEIDPDHEQVESEDVPSGVIP